MQDYFERFVARVVSEVAGVPIGEIFAVTPIPMEHHSVICERVVMKTGRPLRVKDWSSETVGTLAEKCSSR